MRPPTAKHTAPRRTLACIGFDWRVEMSLKSTLPLLQGRTLEHWDYCADLSADVIFYEPGNGLAQALARRAAAEQRQVFLACGGEEEGETALRHPLGASRLIRCLDQASLRLPPAGALPPPQQDSLCQRLDDALQVPGVSGVALLAGERSGVLLPTRGVLHWSVPLDLDEIARLLGSDVGVSALGPADRSIQMSLVQGVAMPATATLWTLGIASSGGRLLQRLDPAGSYRLLRAPDVGMVGTRACDLRWAVMLSHQAMTPAQLAAAAGMPVSQVHNFLNACALCGLLVVMPARAAVPQLSAGGGMLRRIRHVLAA